MEMRREDRGTERCPLHTGGGILEGGCALFKKLAAFRTNGLLRSWEHRSHCQNNIGNAVPRRSRWKRSLLMLVGLPAWRKTEMQNLTMAHVKRENN